MVEFALVFPLLVVLLFGFIEFGRALYQQNVLTKALSSGSRFVARSPDALTVDCGPGSEWSDATSRAADLVVYSSSGGPRLPGLDDPGAVTFAASATASGSMTACVIKGSASTDFAGLFGAQLVPFLGIGSVKLNAVDEERYIGQ